ncbi:choice-of-anchor R domain-containing protein [Tautonia sp. JC769]|uniref:choice-of-anchor R domain-containing protein n=1 Tax=Tautonia sp. JC769 TaxID=3232135 RepID=UPI003457DF26
MNPIRTLSPVVLAAALVLANSARAEVILVDTLGPDNSFNAVGWTIGTSSNIRQGPSFVTPDTPGLFFSGFETVFSRVSRRPNELVIELREDGGGTPGAVLESFLFLDVVSQAASPSVISASSVLRPRLAANTQYWLIASTPTSNQFIWHLNELGEFGQLTPHAFTSGDAPFSVNDRQPMPALRVKAGVIPEPSSLVSLGIGLVLVGGAIARRWRSRA